MPELDPIGVSVPDGLDWPNEHGQSISQTELEKRIPISVRTKEIFAKSDFRAFSDEFLILNDIVLPDVPTSDVVIESNNNVFVAETLRSQSPIVTSSGIHDWTVTVTLNFQPGPSQTNKLHRLVSQISKHPLVFVYNGRIRRSLNITDPSVTTMFIVESGTLRNSPHTVGDIILDLTLHYFNYKPFSNHFWFNTKMPGYKQDERTQVQREQPIGLVSDGYEASAHSLDYEAERITKELREETLKLSNGPNVPINFPAVSDAWMYYADHLANLTPRVHERTSDYIGFSLRAYEHHNPPQKSQRVGAGLLVGAALAAGVMLSAPSVSGVMPGKEGPAGGMNMNMTDMGPPAGMGMAPPQPRVMASPKAYDMSGVKMSSRANIRMSMPDANNSSVDFMRQASQLANGGKVRVRTTDDRAALNPHRLASKIHERL